MMTNLTQFNIILKINGIRSSKKSIIVVKQIILLSLKREAFFIFNYKKVK